MLIPLPSGLLSYAVLTMLKLVDLPAAVHQGTRLLGIDAMTAASYA